MPKQKIRKTKRRGRNNSALGNPFNDLVRRTFDGPSKAPYGGSMTWQRDGFHTTPQGKDSPTKHGAERAAVRREDAKSGYHRRKTKLVAKRRKK